MAIQEHCNAIKQILQEENEHWKEIHTAIRSVCFPIFLKRFFRVDFV